jgi:hypothetical protein
MPGGVFRDSLVTIGGTGKFFHHILRSCVEERPRRSLIIVRMITVFKMRCGKSWYTKPSSIDGLKLCARKLPSAYQLMPRSPVRTARHDFDNRTEPPRDDRFLIMRWFDYTSSESIGTVYQYWH